MTASMRHTYGYIKGDTAYYFLRDHQGSVRQVVCGADGSVVQENQYYPYGAIQCWSYFTGEEN